MDEEYENWYTYDGAKELAWRINDYWEQRGYDAGATVFSLGSGFPNGHKKEGMDMVRYGIRSNMVNGIPTKRKAPA